MSHCLKTLLLSLLVLCIALSACKKEITQNSDAQEQPEEQDILPVEQPDPEETAVASYMAGLTDEHIITQLFVIGIDGSDCLHSYAKESFATAAPGCFLLFRANIAGTADEVIDFTHSVQDFFVNQKNLIPPVFSIDNEGGYIYRISDVASPLLSPKKTAELFTPVQAEEYYSAVARQMRLLGMHINLAPLVEVKTDSNAEFLGIRSYGNLDQVIEYGSSAVKGYEKEKVAVVLKHFPGNTNDDPHSKVPHLTVSRSELEEQYIAPFKKLFELNPSCLLLSHIITDCIDDERPACLSHALVTDLLKNELGFEGIIFSDDIFMGALSKSGFTPEQAAVAAVEAGVDFIMMSEKNYDKAYNALLERYVSDEDFKQKVHNSAERIIKLKIKLDLLQVAPADGGYTLKAVPLQSVQYRKDCFKKEYTAALALYKKIINGEKEQ